MEKKVLRISIDGKFHQYLLLSEVRFITSFVKLGVVTVELVGMSTEDYKLNFTL